MIVSFKSFITAASAFFIILSNPGFSQDQTEVHTSIDLNIFPNPNNGTFYITLVDQANYPSQLIGMDGRVVKKFYLRNGLNYLSVDVPAGMYILVVRKENTEEQFRIEIK